MPRLIIHGVSREVVATDLTSLCLELGLHAPLMLVEYNGTALTRSEWEGVVLADGDRLELMAVAAGG
jgi:thiamine biosynthesis protein ThiS